LSKTRDVAGPGKGANQDGSVEVHQLELGVLRQPNDTTCGPTCLHAVYRYFGDPIELETVIEEVPPLPGGGTLGVWLACHALKRGYRARIYPYNLQLFDPTWFRGEVDVAERLRRQVKFKRGSKFSVATQAYLDFMALGGEFSYAELNPALLRRYLNKQIPILTGLSATYLYQCARELDDQYDDVRGSPTGHFVVMSGYDRKHREVMVADPLHDNPGFKSSYYRIGMERLIGAILLGIVTYDANLLIVEPTETSPTAP